MGKGISTTLYQCTSCKLQFPFDKIKYSKDGNRIICLDCYNKIINKEERDKAMQKNESKFAQPASEGIKVMCVNCSYKFTYRPKPQLRPKCPYCGKNNIRKYEELTADKLLNEAEKMDVERSNRLRKY